MFKKSYYLIPEQTGAKAYALLREAMSQDGRVGVAKVSFRDKEHLAALRFKDEALTLETMYWPDEIREAEFGDADVDVKVRDQELAMARQLIESLTAEWNPEEYTDEYREALMQIVEAKVNGEEIEVVEPEPTAKVVDLMEALKASVAAAKKGDEPKAASGGGSRSSGGGSSKKKTAAKKTSSSKKTSSTKKTAARKKAVGE
jgi:DNA end-binding protein Ku